ncbi:MAG: hypothetical protein ACXVP5_05545 [Tumebacillaceae bacterium]
MRKRFFERTRSIDIPFEMVADEQAIDVADPIQSAQEAEEVDVSYYKWMTMMSIWPYM